jgi:ketosteroid isomerase-like protein
MRFWPAGTRVEAEPIGTIGDRIALHRTRWTGAPDGNAFEVERISVCEVDATGRLRTAIRFDPDDRAAASVEAMERFVAGEAAAAEGLAAHLVFTRAFSRQRWDEMRAAMVSDFVFVDHRTLGLGTLDADRWITSIQALADLAPDLAAETRQVLAWNRHGLVSVVRNFGTVPDGGPFENLYVQVLLIAGGRIQRYEAFDPTDADRAVARFAELCVTS